MNINIFNMSYYLYVEIQNKLQSYLNVLTWI